jgi:hypothetical protein
LQYNKPSRCKNLRLVQKLQELQRVTLDNRNYKDLAQFRNFTLGKILTEYAEG